ncbi:hypothetical protein EV385_5515 [Krasilnikovia cinnamomea]|uniref:Uncharacterized protein n=1 Tax=Krasilnikovia cinnamomea TaxID=349313 RepID=A0A4Q7ZSU2_9ACTN|nr:hypothetical protein EV385_5515 [Krasilnikovia cinnamomea]
MINRLRLTHAVPRLAAVTVHTSPATHHHAEPSHHRRTHH